MFEMLTGETPFSGKTLGYMLVKHLKEEPSESDVARPEPPDLAGRTDFRFAGERAGKRTQRCPALQAALDEVKDKVEQQASLVGNTLAGNVTKGQERPPPPRNCRPARQRKKRKSERCRSMSGRGSLPRAC